MAEPAWLAELDTLFSLLTCCSLKLIVSLPASGTSVLLPSPSLTTASEENHRLDCRWSENEEGQGGVTDGNGRLDVRDLFVEAGMVVKDAIWWPCRADAAHRG
jgi:hypothetical protein